LTSESLRGRRLKARPESGGKIYYLGSEAVIDEHAPGLSLVGNGVARVYHRILCGDGDIPGGAGVYHCFSYGDGDTPGAT
jgi:hypothetical protein